MVPTKIELINLLKKKNYRISKIREAIIDIMVKYPHTTIGFIIKRLKERFGENGVNLMSVYNTLDLFIREHLLFCQTFNGRQISYELVDETSVHFICDKCGTIVHANREKFKIEFNKNLFISKLNQLGWEPTLHYQINLHSICQRCSKNKNN